MNDEKYKKAILLLTFAAFLGTGVLVAGVGGLDEEFYPAEDEGGWLQRTFSPTDQQKQDALAKKADKSIVSGLATGQIDLRFEAAKRQTRSKDKGAQAQGIEELKKLAENGLEKNKFEASFFLFRSGQTKYAQTALDGSGKPGGANWYRVTEAVLDNSKTNSMGMVEIHKQLLALGDKENAGNTKQDIAKREDAKRDVKRLIQHMMKSKNSTVKTYGQTLRESTDGRKLFGVLDKLGEKLNDGRKAVKRKINGKPAKTGGAGQAVNDGGGSEGEFDDEEPTAKTDK